MMISASDLLCKILEEKLIRWKLTTRVLLIWDFFFSSFSKQLSQKLWCCIDNFDIRHLNSIAFNKFFQNSILCKILHSPVLDVVYLSVQLRDIVIDQHFVWSLSKFFDRIERRWGCSDSFIHRKSICHEKLVQWLIPVSLIIRDNRGYVSTDRSIHSKYRSMWLRMQRCRSSLLNVKDLADILEHHSLKVFTLIRVTFQSNFKPT